MNSILRKVVPQGLAATADSCRQQMSSISLVSVLWDSALAVGTLGDGCMALLAGAHTWQRWRSSLPLSFCPLVASFSISPPPSPPFPPPPPHPLFRPALSANVLQNDKSSIFKFGIEALACVVAGACLFLSCLRLREIISRSPSCLCCDPCVGGGASREHRGADEALGMPAGGEEPGAAEGESRRRRPRQPPYFNEI